MSLLSALELQEIVNAGVMENVKPEHINAASIDITLGDTILVEEVSYETPVVSLRDKQRLKMQELDITNGHVLLPGRFILASSREVFNLPNWLSAEYKLKSSMARIGLEHLNAGWCDAGWHGSVLTLELFNCTRHHGIEIRAGDRIGQVVFFRHAEVPTDFSYATKGRYNQDKTVSQVKKDAPTE
jgi:dCTP deaminase